MERTDLLAAQKLFGVPEEFFEEANAMVKESEWILILAMGPDPVPEKELEKRKAIASGTVKARKADKRTDPDVSDYFEISRHISPQ